MTQPCDHISTIIKHGEDIARSKQEAADIIKVLTKLSETVEVIADKMSTIKGFLAGAAAVGGGIVALVVFLVKSLPGVVTAVIK